MSATVWVIGDTHFGHANILKFKRVDGSPLRQFDSIEEHDECLIACWNSVVRPQDHIYHLGDVAIKTPGLGVIKHLNGHKRLVRGNHDIFKTKQYIQVGFEEIYGVRVFDGLMLSHIPLHPLSIRRGTINVHGHLHANPSPEGPYFNASAEMLDYTPITIDDVRNRTRELIEKCTENKMHETQYSSSTSMG